MRLWLAAVITLLALVAGPAAARETGFLNRTIMVDGQPRRYVIYVPADASPHPPLILALHGAGERGSDGLAQSEVGLGREIRLHADRWPAVVVFPQVPAERNWADERRLALAALAKAAREFSTDPQRLYAVGLSMGGNGAWIMANDDPRRFSAIVVACGFAGPFHDYPGVVTGVADPYGALARRIAPLPVWLIHGDADPVVPVTESRQMAAALKAAGSDVRYHELAGVGHVSWEAGFADPDLPVWLFSQRRR